MLTQSCAILTVTAGNTHEILVMMRMKMMKKVTLKTLVNLLPHSIRDLVLIIVHGSRSGIIKNQIQIRNF